MHRLRSLHSDDARDVLGQLLKDVSVVVKTISHHAPFGSTFATETVHEVELAEAWVTIPRETDTIPIAVEGCGCWNDVHAVISFYNPQVHDNMITYEAQLVSQDEERRYATIRNHHD